jgi:hypothetical protein
MGKQLGTSQLGNSMKAMLGSIQIKLVIISGEIVLRSPATIILQTGGAGNNTYTSQGP